jgi:phycocyanobilin lyase subunit alpha
VLESNPEIESNSKADGEALTVEQAIANLHHEDVSLRYYAAWWLGKFQVRESAAVEALIGALEDEDDRTELGGYPLRRNAARALGKLGDRRAVSGLIRCLDCEDFYVRESAAQSLGMLGDPSSIPNLMALLEGGLAAAQFVPGRPHLTQPYEAVLEALGALGAAQAVDLIRPFLDHAVVRVQYATARALYQLTHEAIYGDRLVQALQGKDVQLRRSALSDLGAIGYLPAADAIAQAPAENSFKLLALKGLLEQHLESCEFSDLSSELEDLNASSIQNSKPKTQNSKLSPAALHVMTLMDTLL